MDIVIKEEKKLQAPPILRGWKATLEEREEAIKNNKMLHIYAGTSNVCDLHCIYCSTSGGKALEGEMTLDERKNVLRQAKKLGCKYVHISGAGEPTQDPLLWEQIEYINQLGMIPTVFTHAKDISMEIAQKFYDMNCSVIVKIHSVREELQDFYAGEKGYTQKRSKSIDNLIKVGLNKCNPTRLGADIMITNGNKMEIPDIFRWARKNNIFPLVKSIICRERAHDEKIQKMLEISAKDVERIFYKLLQIDEEEFGYTWIPTPPMAAVTCDYNYYHMMVTIQGNIKPCIGFSPIGNMKEMDNALEYYWNSETMKKYRNIKKNLKGTCATCEVDCYGCPCRRVARQRRRISMGNVILLGGEHVIMISKEDKLIDIVDFAIENCNYYKKTLRKINSIKDFEQLPIIDGNILKNNTPPNNTNMLSGELKSSFIFSTGGTTGTPKYTFRDFKDFDDNHSYFDALNIKPTDIVANLFAPGIWGTYTSHNIGLVQTGCVIIPMGANDISDEKAEFSINTMKKMGVNTVIGTPSIIIVLIEKLKKYNIDLEIKKIYTVGELMYDSTYNYIASFFKDVNIKSMYGSVDCAGIGIQCEHCIKTKYHILDYVYVEIVDDDGKVLPIGQEGNIIVTVLKKRLVPIIRYKLGDRGIICKDKCNCGKEILNVFGRNDNKFIVACTMLSLKTIEENLKSITDRFQIVLDRIESKDKLTLIVESDNDSEENKKNIKEKIFLSEPELKNDIKIGRCVEPEIIIVKPYSLPVNEHSGKVKRIIDKRK